MPLLLSSIPNAPTVVKKGKHFSCAGVFMKGWKQSKQYSITVAEGASADIRFFFLGNNAHSFPLRCTSIQKGSGSSVRISFRSVLFDSSSVDESTLLAIESGAAESRALFSHHILLVSPLAKGKTTPSFEIKTDRVMAKHAASVSALDDEALYYLSTRGCDSKAAQKLLIHGFLSAESSSIQDNTLKNKTEHIIDSFIDEQISYDS
ncbi:MAG: SufD family Fe-S cluster assembly protein [Patescibacteria group bacterium]